MRPRVFRNSKTLFALFIGLFCAACSSCVFARLSQTTQVANGNLVQFPSPEVEFIIGPQVKSGTEPIAARFDNVATRRAKYWATQYLNFSSPPLPRDQYFNAMLNGNYYDLTLCLYTQYYRTGDPALLEYARQVADKFWASPSMNNGAPVPGPDRPSPRNLNYLGQMLRALDGRPEMWSHIDEDVRLQFDVYVVARLNNTGLYMDLREAGYIALYAVTLARVLPNSYKLYANGTNNPPTGQVTDGAARRAKYLADAENALVNYLGRLQQPDGSWRWALTDGTLSDFEQPFMVGIYLESVVALHRLSRNEKVKAKLANQLTRACEHLYRDTYIKAVTPGITTIPRVTLYFYPRERITDPQASDRHLTTSIIHAFGYAYKVTGNAQFKTWGDELWDSCFVTSDGWRSLMDETTYTKLFTTEFRSAGRYLAWRQDGRSSAATPVSGAPVSGPLHTEPASVKLISTALSGAIALSASDIGKDQVEGLIDQIKEAHQVFSAEKGQFLSPETVLGELEAALNNARIALAMVTASSQSQEAKSRVEWAAARLKRAKDRMRIKGS